MASLFFYFVLIYTTNFYIVLLSFKLQLTRNWSKKIQMQDLNEKKNRQCQLGENVVVALTAL